MFVRELSRWGKGSLQWIDIYHLQDTEGGSAAKDSHNLITCERVKLFSIRNGMLRKRWLSRQRDCHASMKTWVYIPRSYIKNKSWCCMPVIPVQGGRCVPRCIPGLTGHPVKPNLWVPIRSPISKIVKEKDERKTHLHRHVHMHRQIQVHMNTQIHTLTRNI